MSDKIGIITFHRAVNFGAVLQAYATQQFLNQNGMQAEIIDYRCEKFKGDYRIIRRYDHSIKGLVKALVKAPVIYKRNQKFHHFLKKNIRVSDVVYDYRNIQESNKVYSSFITGSDQVWNLKLTGGDSNYLLSFVMNPNRKNSFAASMGSVMIDLAMKEEYKKYLKDFSAVSVREKDAGELFSHILDRNIPVVLDPVFLLDQSQWNMISRKPRKKGYILVYCLHEQDVYLCAEKLSKLTGLKIICIQNNIKRTIDAEYVLHADPAEFTGYIKDAEYVVTDSYHGTAFGIIFRKQIRVLLKKKNTGLNGRILTLLEEFELLDAIVDTDAADNCLLQMLSYNDACIEAKISETRTYLTDISKEKTV